MRQAEAALEDRLHHLDPGRFRKSRPQDTSLKEGITAERRGAVTDQLQQHALSWTSLILLRYVSSAGPHRADRGHLLTVRVRRRLPMHAHLPRGALRKNGLPQRTLGRLQARLRRGSLFSSLDADVHRLLPSQVAVMRSYNCF